MSSLVAVACGPKAPAGSLDAQAVPEPSAPEVVTPTTTAPDVANAAVDGVSATDAAAAPADVAAAPADGAAPVARDIPDLNEKAITLLVQIGEAYQPVACWLVPAANEPWAPSATPRWESGAACVEGIAVGDRVHGDGGLSGAITAIEGDKLRADVSGQVLVVAPAGDRRLAGIFALRSGPLVPITVAANTPAAANDATADVQGGNAPDVAAAPADVAAAPADVAATDAAPDAVAADAGPTAPAPVAAPSQAVGRWPASADQVTAVTRAVKRINGSDYPQADITVGTAVVADLNGDDKPEVVVLASSIDTSGEGHSSGGGAFLADGRTPTRFLDLAIDGQMTDIDLIALSDLDGNGRREFLIEMECPTGTGYYLGQLGGDGGDGANISGVTTLGSVEEQGLMCAGIASTIKQALPYRTFANARVEAVGLGAFADLLGVASETPVATLASRFGEPFSETADEWNTLGATVSFMLADGAGGKVVRGIDIDREGALAVAERSGELAGLPQLLDMTPKELNNALRATLGKHRLATGPGVSYDGTLPDGRGLLVTFVCPSETAACDSVRVVSYVPRKGLTTRMNLLGLSRRSTQADLEKLFGAHEVAAGAAAATASFAGGKISATFADGTLKSLTVTKEGVAAIKKPGPFANVGEPLAGFVTRWGAADGNDPKSATWSVPAKTGALFTINLACSESACDAMTVTFE